MGCFDEYTQMKGGNFLKKTWFKPLARELSIDLTAGNAYGHCDPRNPNYDPLLPCKKS
jgi:hypothetical protein